jgi:hypothetical protein
MGVGRSAIYIYPWTHHSIIKQRVGYVTIYTVSEKIFKLLT